MSTSQLSENPAVLNLADAKLLGTLCQQGKLYEVEKWIANGESLVVPPEYKTTPLQIALDCGFHSLVQLLARSEHQTDPFLIGSVAEVP